MTPEERNKQIEELKELAGKATQGEWTYFYEGSGDYLIHTKRGKIAYKNPEYCAEDEVATFSGPDSCMMGGEQTEKDMKYMVSLYNNALPIIDALEEENKWLREALKLHHKWQSDPDNEIFIKIEKESGEIEYFEITGEYADSTMCEKTQQALEVSGG